MFEVGKNQKETKIYFNQRLQLLDCKNENKQLNQLQFEYKKKIIKPKQDIVERVLMK